MLSELESDRVERTVSINNTDKFGQAICAFANDFPNHRQPGYLIVGASDDGRPTVFPSPTNCSRTLQRCAPMGTSNLSRPSR